MTVELKDALATINNNIGQLKKEYFVKKVGIFGSVAKGKSTKKSDIDVLVEFNKPVGFFKFIKLENFLKRKLKRKVDLITKNGIKPILKKTILKEVVYAK